MSRILLLPFGMAPRALMTSGLSLT
uniref:Uncharacterized protein n=1 Tax=Macrostomum lignano TaxID=282301 RepID=A0A1I8J1G1_9PLAT